MAEEKDVECASRQNQVLEELRREHHEKLEAWVRGLCVSLNPTDAVGVNEIESPYDCRAGIGAAIQEITDSTEADSPCDLRIAADGCGASAEHPRDRPAGPPWPGLPGSTRSGASARRLARNGRTTA
jgi:hypothetical protein